MPTDIFVIPGAVALPIPATQGGTGQTSYATGDILYASAPNVLSRLPIGTAGQILEVAGGIPAWSTGAGVSQVANKRYVDFLNGSDANSGAFTSPWKTLNFAYTQITDAAPAKQYVIYISGGNQNPPLNDTDTPPIAAKPNIHLIAEYSTHLVIGNMTITGGSGSDRVILNNITVSGNLTWTRSDATNIFLGLFNSTVTLTLNFSQTGAGFAAMQAEYGLINTVTGTMLGATFHGTQVANATFGDVSGAGFTFDSCALGALSFSGGVTANFYGCSPNSMSITTATTVSGTPAITSDSGSITVPITGPGTITWVDNAAILPGRAGGQVLNGGLTVADQLALQSGAATGQVNKNYVTINDGSGLSIIPPDGVTDIFNFLGVGVGFPNQLVIGFTDSLAGVANPSYLYQGSGGGRFDGTGIIDALTYTRGTFTSPTATQPGDYIYNRLVAFSSDNAGHFRTVAADSIVCSFNAGDNTGVGAYYNWRLINEGAVGFSGNARDRFQIRATGVFAHPGQTVDGTFVNVVGTNHADTLATDNVAGGPTDAYPHTILANTLNVANDSLEIEAAGQFAATGSTDKRITVSFGGTTFFDSGPLAVTTAQTWILRGSIMRIGSASQRWMFTLVSSGSVAGSTTSQEGTGAVDNTVDQILKLTLNATNTGDVTTNFYKDIWSGFGPN